MYDLFWADEKKSQMSKKKKNVERTLCTFGSYWKCHHSPIRVGSRESLCSIKYHPILSPTFVVPETRKVTELSTQNHQHISGLFLPKGYKPIWYTFFFFFKFKSTTETVSLHQQIELDETIKYITIDHIPCFQHACRMLVPILDDTVTLKALFNNVSKQYKAILQCTF